MNINDLVKRHQQFDEFYMDETTKLLKELPGHTFSCKNGKEYVIIGSQLMMISHTPRIIVTYYKNTTLVKSLLSDITLHN